MNQQLTQNDSLDYRTKIEELKRVLNQDISEEPGIKKSRKEIERLETVKSTIEFFKEQNRLKLSKLLYVGAIPIFPEKESIKTDTKNKNEMDNKSVKEQLTLPMIIAIVLSVVIILCVFSSWIQINGMEISLTSLLDTLENLSYWSNGNSLDDAIGILQFLCIAIWAIAIVYGIIIYQLYKVHKSNFIEIGTGLVAVIILFLLIMSETFNSETGVYLQLSITGAGWIALIASIATFLIYRSYIVENGYKINLNIESLQRTIGQENYSEQKVCAVTNYYPWIEMRIQNLILEKGTKNSLTLEYTFFAEEFDNIFNIFGKSKKVDICADVLIWTTGKTYSVENCMFQAAILQNRGVTNHVFVVEIPFLLSQIVDVKVIIKKIDISGSKSKIYPGIHVDTNMNWQAIQGYREKNGKTGAICEEKIIGDVWQCSCGLVNDRQKEKCGVCGERRHV